MPAVSYKHQLPVHEKYRFMALDEDGHDLPPDWYMRICGFAAEGLRGDRLILGTFPSKELQDYWSTRPKYEDEAGPSSAGGSGSKVRKDNRGRNGRSSCRTRRTVTNPASAVQSRGGGITESARF